MENIILVKRMYIRTFIVNIVWSMRYNVMEKLERRENKG